MTMIHQRPRGAAPVIQASGGALPPSDESFAASLAILTIHHWPAQADGLLELRRSARDRVVILTWDPAFPGFWLTDYFPRLLEVDRVLFPSMDTFARELGPISVFDVPIPRDCKDGFHGAYWGRPTSYLNASVRSAMSTFARIGDIKEGLSRLDRDIRSGDWNRHYGSVSSRDSLDLGYRIIVAD